MLFVMLVVLLAVGMLTNFYSVPRRKDDGKDE